MLVYADHSKVEQDDISRRTGFNSFIGTKPESNNVKPVCSKKVYNLATAIFGQAGNDSIKQWITHTINKGIISIHAFQPVNLYSMAFYSFYRNNNLLHYSGPLSTTQHN